eukprot:7317465-Pyramimonas_sp.AAC.1
MHVHMPSDFPGSRSQPNRDISSWNTSLARCACGWRSTMKVSSTYTKRMSLNAFTATALMAWAQRHHANTPPRAPNG